MPVTINQRLLELSKNKSFFLFGARGAGKSTLIEQLFHFENTLLIDLLDTEEYLRFKRKPSRLYDIVIALPEKVTYVVIDEVRKLPKLLDTVQRLMKEKKWSFLIVKQFVFRVTGTPKNLIMCWCFLGLKVLKQYSILRMINKATPLK